MVEFIIGKREQISFAEEGTYGTAVTPTDVLGREATFDPNKDAQNWVEIRGAADNSVNVTERELGPKSAGGTLNFAPQNWKWLKFVLCDGSSDVADSDQGSYYKHDFSNSHDVASFTLERAMRLTDGNDHVVTYEGCQVNSASITWDAGGGAGGALVKVNLDVMAEDLNSGTSTTSLSAPTTNAFQFRNVKFTLNNNEITEVTGGTINIENNLHDARYANYTKNRIKGESGVTVRRINGTVRMLVKDSTYYDLWDAASTVGNTNIVFQRDTNDKLTLTLTDFRIESPPDPTKLEGINEVTLNWTAKDATAVAEDSISSYD